MVGWLVSVYVEKLVLLLLGVFVVVRNTKTAYLTTLKNCGT